MLAFSRLTADGRALAAMHEAPKFGLGCMPSVESAIASLIVPPDEALRPNARCPRPQCHITDDLLCRAYNSGAWMGRIGNSLSHLLLGLSSSLESVPLDQSTQGLLDASLQAFALMTRELGRTLYAGPCSAPDVAGPIILNRALQENTEGSSCGSGGTLWFRCT
ncbi:hypothetical protein ATANTOWER_019664 [Ataeniobius toweri]|uniref:Uncharacterized protein n=1 Tax=Ataeniobius toweri TaxID=208326 RepID=A0ABU7AQ30_9TELE|nr:hypothetical protein [Ataeniobius toweri]